MDDDALRQPSLLPGWNRDVLVAHLTSAGRAALRCAEAAIDNRSVAMYPGGAAQRDREIAAGSGSSKSQLVAELAEVCARCDDAFAAASADALQVTMESLRGPIPLAAVILQRWLDVEAHRVDLDTGYTTDDWSSSFAEQVLPIVIQGMPAMRARPDADRDVTGRWLLAPTDAPQRWVIRADAVEAAVEEGSGGDCEIQAPTTALLALLLGRAVHGPLEIGGDGELASRFKDAFPGP